MIAHDAPKSVVAGQALTLTLHVSPAADVIRIRLHYRTVNQLAEFKIIEKTMDQPSFTIPAEYVSLKWDLMYYFEMPNREGSGWFQPIRTLSLRIMWSRFFQRHDNKTY